MGGGLLQLVAYGAQDVYLTGNPQITFFKVVYRRHTNFAIEAIQQTFNGNPGYGNRVTCQISRNGDLIHRMYLAVDMSAESEEVCPYFGLRLVDYVELEIGGQKIDKQYSHWMYVWNELSLPVSKRNGYKKMVGGDGGVLKDTSNDQLYVPLEFWFCRNVGLALPLIALQYHEVKINIEYESAANLVDTNDANLCEDEDAATGADLTLGAACTNGNRRSDKYTVDFGKSLDDSTGNATTKFATGSNVLLRDANLWVDYVFLDTDERRRFAQLSHEYLIEQLQFTGTDTMTQSASANSMKPVRLNFNHPCKELVWAVTDGAAASTGQTRSTNFTDVAAGTGDNCVADAQLQLNGHDRMSKQSGKYFNYVQTLAHSNTPSAGINVYSFALNPEEHQPSGT